MRNIFRRLLVTILVLCSLYWPATGATPTFHFKHLTIEDGLGNLTVTSIVQDRLGFVWIGTMDGLYKYDGERIISVMKDFFEEGNEVHEIQYSAMKEKLWLLVNNSIFTYDLRTEVFEQEKIAFHGEIETIFVDASDRLWVALTEGGLYTYEDAGSRFVPITDIPELKGNTVVKIRQEEEHTYGFLTQGGGLFIYDAAKHTSVRLAREVKRASTYTKDAEGNYWIGTFYGLYQVAAADSRVHHVVLDAEKEKKIFYITKILVDRSGLLYIATDSGLYTYNPDSRQVNVYKAKWEHDGYLNCNYLNDIYLDKENTLWLATFFGGVNYLTDPNFGIGAYDYVNEQMAGHVISSFAEDERGNLWIGTNDEGISYFDTATGNVVNFNCSDKSRAIADFHNIHSLLYDDGLLYVGMSSAGLNMYDTRTKQCKKLYSNTVIALHKMNDGRIAVGKTDGLDVYDPKTGQTVWEKDVPATRVNHIFSDEEGSVWVCTDRHGIYVRRTGDVHFRPIGKEQGNWSVQTGAQSGNSLYFGTKYHGVVRYDLADGKISVLLEKELEDHQVNSIIAQDSFLWISTTDGLYRYNVHGKGNQERDNYIRLVEAHGLKSMKMRNNASIRMRNGNIFIGTFNGINGFRPQDVRYSAALPKTIFTKLQIDNEWVQPKSSGAPLHCALPYTRKIELSYLQSSFSISFAPVNHSQKRGVTYRYRLKPMDKKWNYTENNVLDFRNLQSGQYTLTVQSCNEYGRWDEKGASLDITILPPWWKSVYMYVVYLLLLGVGLYITVRTVRKKHEQHIREVKLEQQQKQYLSKMEFFTHIIHDIRTPLTLILAPLQKLIAAEDSRSYRNDLEIMQRNGEQLLRNVNQLMDFQKVEQGINGYEEREIVDIVKELQLLLYDFKAMADNRNIQMVLSKGETDSPCCALVNRECFIKIFMNLIGNAVKFTHTRIEIRVENFGNHCKVSVADDGPGIAEAVQKTIFEPFYQIKGNLPTDNIGTGIGLSIVRKMVEKIDAEITLESSVGKGTTFVLSIPIQQVPDTSLAYEKPLPAAVASVGEKEEQEETAARWNLFVAEDNADLRSLLISVLQPYYNVRGYANGQELLDDLVHYPCDLIISDVMMPVLDGIELCKAVKGKAGTCHLPVVLLTAKVMEEDEISGLDHGADLYICKPFSVKVLLAQVRSLLKNRELLSQKYQKEPETQLVETITNEEEIKFLEKLDEVIAHNLRSSNLNANFVASEMCMCRSLFFSKIKVMSGMTFTDYVRVRRLKNAVDMMKTRKYTFNEIAESVGFSSPSFFTRSFKKQFDLTPSEYMEKLDKEVQPSNIGE